MSTIANTPKSSTAKRKREPPCGLFWNSTLKRHLFSFSSYWICMCVCACVSIGRYPLRLGSYSTFHRFIYSCNFNQNCNNNRIILRACPRKRFGFGAKTFFSCGQTGKQLKEMSVHRQYLFFRFIMLMSIIIFLSPAFSFVIAIILNSSGQNPVDSSAPTIN